MDISHDATDEALEAALPFTAEEPPPQVVCGEFHEGGLLSVPLRDNMPGAPQSLLKLNAELRSQPWPPPFDSTTHSLCLGDARAISLVADESVHLVVTSPPYWSLKRYHADREGQLGDVDDYQAFLVELDKVWRECYRALVPGGRVCCVVGDVCIPRRRHGRHLVMPLHADIQVRSRELGFDCLTPIIWHKIANGAMEANGNGSGFYGKPYQPGAVVKNDVEYILFLRKGGEYRKVSWEQKVLSMLTKHEMQSWLRSIWTDVRGASTRNGHPAPFPVELAERLIKLFSFAGDTVLDPFTGTGSTQLAALLEGRNSIGIEIEPAYIAMAYDRLLAHGRKRRDHGATRSVICRTGF